MLALLYDVHGNLPALEAVLEDCPADRFLLGGDHVGFGAWPRETAERLPQLDAEWIRGNVDRWLADAPDAPQAMAGGTQPLPEPQDGDAERLMGVEARRVVFGHTHLQFRRQGPGGVDLLNPGSVGIPLD